ncbi:hypothetical protein [Arvimicrobium flavum]|uniref:hypothetical protein n=1 Tax=Arvimicrobium flavum TaxID=3393320 RepID=UPI00237C524D|nr:hypothetical protein [Mesorhizobium shangrilense]
MENYAESIDLQEGPDVTMFNGGETLCRLDFAMIWHDALMQKPSSRNRRDVWVCKNRHLYFQMQKKGRGVGLWVGFSKAPRIVHA